MREKGHTLIKIIVVIAVIAIIVYMLIPSLIICKFYAYETSGHKTLKSLCEVQATWRKKDLDRNGQEDYWCLDVAGLFYALDIYGNQVQLVDYHTGKADPLVATYWATASGIYAPYSTNGGYPRNGYFFSVLTTDGDGNSYLQTTTSADLDGPSGYIFRGSQIAIGNKTRFGFIAWPGKYGEKGCQNFFIANQSNNVYFRDTGDNSGDNGAKIPMTKWPQEGEDINRGIPQENYWAFATD